MRNSIGKTMVLIMILISLVLTGCSSREAGNLSETGDISSKITETAPTDDVPTADISLEDGNSEPVEISIKRDDRSIDLTEYGGDGNVFTCYYETACRGR